MSFTNSYGPATVEGSMRILDECVDLGITHIDTAEAYGMGHSENVIGDWLRARKGTCPFTIASKVVITRNPDQRLDNDPAYVAAALDASL